MATTIFFKNRASKAFDDFFFKPASARPLATLRIGLSLVLLLQAFFIHKNFLNFFAHNGFVQGEVSSAFSDPSIPAIGWFVHLFSFVGIGENITLFGFGILYVISLFFLFCGYYTRVFAFIAWFLHWSFTNTGYSGAYGADTYAHFFLFYLIFIPSGEAYSLDRLFNRVPKEPSYQARLSLRLLQLHMCISYLTSGLEKASGEQWRNGEILWLALNNPDYSVVDFHWLAFVPFLPMLGGWIVLAIEIFYCVMIWPRKTRYLWVFAACLLHIGIAIFLKLHIFGILMCVPTLALFFVSSEPSTKKA